MSYIVKDCMKKEVPTIVDIATVTEAARKIIKVGKDVIIVLRKGNPGDSNRK